MTLKFKINPACTDSDRVLPEHLWVSV